MSKFTDSNNNTMKSDYFCDWFINRQIIQSDLFLTRNRSKVKIFAYSLFLQQGNSNLKLSNAYVNW